MSITLEEAAERIIVCGVHDIDIIFRGQSIGAIVSVADELVLRLAKETFDFSQTIHLESKFEDQVFDLFPEAKSDKKAILGSLRKELDIAGDILENIGDQKLLIHCHAGVHLSPSFTLFLLCHLQADNPDFDLALSTLNRIRPQARLSTALTFYADFFGDNAEEFARSIKDFKLVEKLRRCNTSKETEKVLTDSFESQAKPDQETLGLLFSRFKVDPNALRL